MTAKWANRPAAGAQRAPEVLASGPTAISVMPLSSREREVLRLLALGKSGAEVALHLGISVCTVRVHIRSVIRKLRASNIPHAVTRGFQTGILDLGLRPAAP